jgi:hypothetical protein
MIVVCAIDSPRSAIISTKSRRLSLNGASLFPCYQAIDIAAQFQFGLLIVAM